MTKPVRVRSLGRGSLGLLLLAGCAPQASRPEMEAHEAGAAGTPDTLVSYEDFTRLEVEGYAPYYRDAGWGAVAVNSIQHPNRFGAAETWWRGAPGAYDLTLVTVTEQDGESSYRLSVNGAAIGEFKNPPGADRDLAQHTWRGVHLQPGDAIRIASNSHSNRTVPEGDGFATSRGRWRYLIAVPHR